MIKTEIRLPLTYEEADIECALRESLPLLGEPIFEIKKLRRALKGGGAEGRYFVLRVAFSVSAEKEAGLLKMKKRVSPYEKPQISVPKIKSGKSPVVVGMGPAGLFAALILAEAGAKPILLERGRPVEQRLKDVAAFFAGGALSEISNIQFGEGGAGAFSDGKLKFGARDAAIERVLETLVACGAPEDILYKEGPHVGTDLLCDAVRRIRERLLSLGATVHYEARMCDFSLSSGRVSSVSYEQNGKMHRIETDALFLATGHSARDVFHLLHGKGVRLEAKGFGIGVRVEHPREYMNALVYPDAAEREALGAASYHLVTHLESGRSVYSFCMCPGGTVVAAASEAEGVCTNGMSEHARDAENSNSALLVSVTPEDFPSKHPLAGLELQRRLENAAFLAGGGDYFAPAIRMQDFMERSEALSLGSVHPSYPRGVRLVSPDAYLPAYITESLRAGIADFEKWMPGFYYPDAVLTGVEARSTSPVRVLREGSGEAPEMQGLYPCGEGAGYAGGIVSSAADGVRMAMKFLENANNCEK